MQDTIKYWKGLEELNNTPEFAKHAHNEFPEFLPVKEASESSSSEAAPARRDFLKLLGFGIAAATLASCEAPVKKAIPYLNKPEEIDPGIANWYASTYFQNGDYNSVLVKTREGRPIKLEGNPMSSITRGGLSAKAQASVLSLYDNNRLQAPMIKGKKSDWKTIDTEIMSRLNGVSGKVALVSSTIISPSTKKVIDEFGAKMPSFEHVTYDARSASALIGANGGTVPGYDFSKAKIIVSIAADFLGTWLSPVEYATQYIANRKVTADNPTMSRHYQFEPTLSLTGSNADIRVPVKASEEALVAAALHNAVVGGSLNAGAYASNKTVAAAAADLKANGGAALVVAGSNDPAVQAIVKSINDAIGANGTTINTNAPSFVKQGNDAQMIRLIEEMNNGGVGAVIFYGTNPVYNHPLAARVVSGLQKVAVKVSFAERLDETAVLADYVCPDNHYLESWNDYEPKQGYMSLAQPVITRIFNTRQAQDTLLTWSGNNTSYYDYIRRNWRGIVPGDFNKGWDRFVHDGVMETASGTGVFGKGTATTPMSMAEATEALNRVKQSNEVEVVIYEKVGIGAGDEANNPWLQELPDPVSKATWGNYVTMPRQMAVDMEIEQNDVVKVTLRNGTSTELPVLVQPGQANGTIGIAVGYGRTHAGPAANNIGANAYPLIQVVDKSNLIYANTATIGTTGVTVPIAQTQTHHTIMDRLIVQEASLANYKTDPNKVTKYIRVATPDGAAKPSVISLWQDYEYKDHHWGMAIDLNSCIGCGSCVIGCQAENNIAVVGKQEVLNRREMHWMRIDRYYSAQEHEAKDYKTMENPADNPTVVFQPMLCQHCNHAPCETVCPVAATMHSTDGLNQMAYNRCVGTRYCANNCPYKVRRFNWFAYANNDKFDYNMNNDLGKMVLNPDVMVRGRGVIEKCSFCVQRIQLGKLQAKKDRRRPMDGEIVTACAQSCPTNAIVFGDMLNPESEVSKILKREEGQRAYHVLEELNVQPNVTYLTKIRNLA